MTVISTDAASGLEFISVGETKSPKHIFVMLHGTGGSCSTMQPIAELFVKKLPDTLILIPNGPVPLSELLPAGQIAAAKAADPSFDPDKMRNWSGASKTIVTDEASLIAAVNEVTSAPVKALNLLIDGQMKKYGADDGNLVIYGFSAGGSMALYSAIARDHACAGVISHSGHILYAKGAVSEPNVLMMAGDQELAHPQSQMKQMFPLSVEILRDRGLSVEEHVCKNLGHDLNQEAFETVCRFTAKSLGMAVTPPAKKPPQPKI